MPKQLLGINPKVLVWARERAGHSIEDVAASFKKEPEEIESWETGETTPTYVQLEKLAYVLYKRPIALFFFPAVPKEDNPEKSFRTLPDSEITELAPDTHHKIREARAMQLSLVELTGNNPAQRQILKDLGFKGTDSAEAAAQTVRKYLGVNLNTQKQWKNVTDALKAWRSVVEDVGIFVSKDTFKQRDICGFSLHDDQDEFPVIVINNSTAQTRQLFTLFHELGHLLVHISGITKKDDRYIDNLPAADRQLEIFCNRFAAEFLVPSEDFKKEIGARKDYDDEAISNLANSYKVSREVILRRLLDMRLVSQKRYENDVKRWLDEYEVRAEAEKSGGGNYHATQATYLSEKYAQLAFSKYYRGGISVEQLADYLNVSVKNVPGIEYYVLHRTS
jgi:Zn-dependent peptidase ImmA (M78 family)/transcriptional regulator with XRE-family HTH domain